MHEHARLLSSSSVSFFRCSLAGSPPSFVSRAQLLLNFFSADDVQDFSTTDRQTLLGDEPTMTNVSAALSLSRYDVTVPVLQHKVKSIKVTQKEIAETEEKVAAE